MTITQTGILDFIGINKEGEIVMIISDHLPWDEDLNTHLELLQDKLNSYLQFIENGQVEETISDSANKLKIIELVHNYDIPSQGINFINKVNNFLEGRNIIVRSKYLK